MLTLHVVAHTHWDREWYHPVERFRQRLVALVDELIDDPPRDGTSFLLDGQTIVLDDYLSVRPDRMQALYDLLRDGRLEAGPWFVLADELIPSGEALVRNLLTGRRTLRRIGVDSPPVLYCPDSFGHPAALPSIAAGFGFPLIILWRGYGGRRWPQGDVARWAAPSGDQVVIYHLPRDGYEFGSHLPPDAEGASARWKRIREELAPRSTTGVALLPNGADHHARQLQQREAVDALATAAAPDRVGASSLRAFSEAIVSAASDADLPVVHGELRDSYGYTWTLQGTFATRAHEKRMNARAERLLVREAEPWAALAARVGPSKRPLVDAAWRTLLEAHPHDTLCGCSIDDVADAMELRVRSATNQAIGIRDDALLQLIGHDPVKARVARDDWSDALLIRNPAARVRGGLAIVDVEMFMVDVPVGPGSGPGLPSRPSYDISNLELSPPGSGQLLSMADTHALIESPRHYPDNDLVVVLRVAMWVPKIPAYGVAALSAAGDDIPAAVRALDRWIENTHCRVTIDDRSAVVFEDLVGDRRLDAFIELVHEGDVGDEYTPAPRPPSRVLNAVRVEAGQRGPLIADLALHFHLGEDTSAPLHHDVRKRRSEREPINATPARDVGVGEIVVRLSLEAGSPWLRVDVEGENRLEDHRLRLRFRTDVVGQVWADAAFGPVHRVPLAVPPEDAAMELPPRTAPLHRYVSRFDDRHGCTVFSDGLAEYEAADDGSIYITLLRAVGDLSISGLPERPGHAGWPKRTPGAQCPGAFAGSFALMLHGSRTPETIDAIERAADDVLLPLRGTTLRSALRVPEPVVGVELQGVGLALSTVKESEDGRWLVLRCVNLLDESVAGSWRVPFDVIEAHRARLDETLMDALASIDRVIAFDAGPREIVTLLVR